MEDSQRIRIIASIDLIVAIIIIIIGISMFIYYGAISENISDMIELNEKWANEYGMDNPYMWLEGLPPLIILIGVVTLIYGAERLINNILKLITTNKKQSNQLNVQRYPIDPPNMYKR